MSASLSYTVVKRTRTVWSSRSVRNVCGVRRPGSMSVEWVRTYIRTCWVHALSSPAGRRWKGVACCWLGDDDRWEGVWEGSSAWLGSVCRCTGTPPATQTWQTSSQLSPATTRHTVNYAASLYTICRKLLGIDPIIFVIQKCKYLVRLTRMCLFTPSKCFWGFGPKMWSNRPINATSKRHFFAHIHITYTVYRKILIYLKH